MSETTEEIQSLRKENTQRAENEVRLMRHHHAMATQVSDLKKALDEATMSAAGAKEGVESQRQGHAAVLAFCRESAQGCQKVTKQCITDTKQYVDAALDDLKKARLDQGEVLSTLGLSLSALERKMDLDLEKASVKEAERLDALVQVLEVRFGSQCQEFRGELERHSASLTRLESKDQVMKRQIDGVQAHVEQVEDVTSAQVEDSVVRVNQKLELSKELDSLRSELTEQMLGTADYALQKTLDQLHQAQKESERVAYEAREENHNALEASMEELEQGLKEHMREELAYVLSATQLELGQNLDHTKEEVDGLTNEVRHTARGLEKRIERIHEEVSPASSDNVLEAAEDVGEVLKILRRKYLEGMDIGTPEPSSNLKTSLKSSKGGKSTKKKTRSSSVPRAKALKVSPKEALSVARAVMRVADVNKNRELSFTEITSMLEASPYQDFGRWMKEGKQKCFSKYDADQQGSININELVGAVMDFLKSSKWSESAKKMIEKATAPSKHAFVSTVKVSK